MFWGVAFSHFEPEKLIHKGCAVKAEWSDPTKSNQRADNEKK
jgi:hypothetical protein